MEKMKTKDEPLKIQNVECHFKDIFCSCGKRHILHIMLFMIIFYYLVLRVNKLDIILSSRHL